MKSEQVIAAVTQDRWSAVRGTHDDDPFMFRYREGFCDVTDFSGYSRALVITWTYTHDGYSGIPDRDELSELEDFENRLVECFEHDFLAVLDAVLTERGTRQWLFYASDIPECQRRLGDMPQKSERYPIVLVTETDENWSRFHDKIQTICGSDV